MSAALVYNGPTVGAPFLYMPIRCLIVALPCKSRMLPVFAYPSQTKDAIAPTEMPPLCLRGARPCATEGNVAINTETADLKVLDH